MSDDKTGFVAVESGKPAVLRSGGRESPGSVESGKPFVRWGVNYDHDDKGRLLEDYWQSEWSLVERHFAAIKELKANVVRIHLQFGKFMDGRTTANRKSLEQLARLVALAERTKLYLDLTGLGCYHKQDVPAWYDDLSEQERWDAQAGVLAVGGRNVSEQSGDFLLRPDE